MYLKFSIWNGEYHSTHEILTESTECASSSYDTESPDSLNTDECLCTSVSHATSSSSHIDRSFISRTRSKVHDLNKGIISLETKLFEIYK